MRRDFRNKICAYCATETCESDEHIFARKFFLERDRGDLPKAPACKKCNGLKSAIEDYCLCVLPLASQHKSAVEVATSLLPRRLQHAGKRRLRQSLRDGQGRIFVQEGSEGLARPTMTLPLDGEKVKELIQYIVKGLVWFHWKGYLTIPSPVAVFTFVAEGERRFKEVMRQFAVVG